MGFGKRLVSVAVVIIFAAALLYGSITAPAGEVSDGEVPEYWYNRKETIYFWYSDESLSNFINNAAVSFNEKENVRVIPVLTSGNEYLEAVNNASLHSDQVPDAYVISHDSLEKAYLAGLATQIQDGDGVCSSENFPAAALSAVSYHGKLVAYPLSFDTSVLVYNDTYLAQWAKQAAELAFTAAGQAADEAAVAAMAQEYYANAIPASVDDILRVADSFELPEGVEGVFKWAVSDIFYNYWFVGNYMIVGGDSGDNEELLDIDNEETVRCLEVYKALNQFFYIEPDTVTYDSVLQDFIDGKLVFTIVTANAVERLADAEKREAINFDYGIARLPDVSGELKSRAMSVTNAVAVNGYSKNKELANKFAAYLTNECAGSMYERSGKVPAKFGAHPENGALQIFWEEYEDSVPLPKMMRTENFWLLLEGLFSKVWNGDDVTEMVQKLEDRISLQINSQAY